MASTYVPLSQAPKLKYTPIEDFLKARKESEATAPTGQAMSYYQGAAAGKPTPALSSAFAANREALARQAGSMRAQTAQTLVQGGGLGQGQAIRGTQETEQGILRAMADSRNKEAQAIGTMQEGANQVLLDEGNRTGRRTMQAIEAGLNSKSPAMQQASLKALSGYLEGQGVQMATGESADALDSFHATQAENDPKVALERLTSEQALKKLQAQAAFEGSGSDGQKIAAAVAQTGLADEGATKFTSLISTPHVNDANVWRQNILPNISKPNASQIIDGYVALRNAGYKPEEIAPYLTPNGIGVDAARAEMNANRARNKNANSGGITF